MKKLIDIQSKRENHWLRAISCSSFIKINGYFILVDFVADDLDVNFYFSVTLLIR